MLRRAFLLSPQETMPLHAAWLCACLQVGLGALVIDGNLAVLTSMWTRVDKDKYVKRKEAQRGQC